MFCVSPPRAMSVYCSLFEDYIMSTVRHAGMEVYIECGLSEVLHSPHRRLGPPDTCVAFSLDGRQGIINYTDGPVEGINFFRTCNVPVFSITAGSDSEFHNFPPCSFYNWSACYDSGHQWSLSNTVAHRQTIRDNPAIHPPHSMGCQRLRRHALEIIQACGLSTQTDLLRPWDFLRLGQKCLVSVHVQGTYEQSLDRAQWQQMAFGVPTVSPRIACSPCGVPLIPGVHYIEVNPDLSDLAGVLHWCDANRDDVITVGANARTFFRDNGTPHAILDYMKGKLGL